MTIVCDCAAIPPTMPTCRGHHLADCPAAELTADAAATLSAAAADAIRHGDKEALVDLLKSNARARAEARVLRLRATRATTFLALALTVACGGSRPTPQPPSPAPPAAPVVVVVDPPADPFVRQLVFPSGQRDMIRPALGHAFSVRAGVGIDPGMLDAALAETMRVARAHEGAAPDVGLVRDLRADHDLIVEVADEPQLYRDGKLWAIELAFREVRAGVIVRCRVAIATGWAFPQVTQHGLLHCLGYGDLTADVVAPGPYVMGGAPLTQTWVHPRELAAWPAGARRRDAEAGAASALQTVICRRIP